MNNAAELTISLLRLIIEPFLWIEIIFLRIREKKKVKEHNEIIDRLQYETKCWNEYWRREKIV